MDTLEMLGADFEADHMDGDILFCRDLSRERTGIAAAAFSAVSKQHDNTGIVFQIKRIDSLVA